MALNSYVRKEELLKYTKLSRSWMNEWNQQLKPKESRKKNTMKITWIIEIENKSTIEKSQYNQKLFGKIVKMINSSKTVEERERTQITNLKGNITTDSINVKNYKVIVNNFMPMSLTI